MARVVNETGHALRLNEILDSAQKLIYTKGFEQMAVQDICSDLGISKGAFYHYFGSKPELLDALIARTQRQAEELLRPIVDDPSLPALEKLERIFDSAARWKSARKAYMLAILHAWYADENAVVRQKQAAGGARWLTPILAGIVRQGIDEGVMDTPYPDQAGMVAVAMMISLGDTVSAALLSLDPAAGEAARQECLARMRDATAAYTHAVERVLGLPAGSVCLYDPQMLEEWVMP